MNKFIWSFERGQILIEKSQFDNLKDGELKRNIKKFENYSELKEVEVLVILNPEYTIMGGVNLLTDYDVISTLKY
ncbi:MAG: hypothetical protein L3I99_05770 [Sulfurimonas sp.]|nr:hypothetical protein [Sulfurimonas sp.]